MKKSNFENFVGIYDNYFSDELCNGLIEYFEWCNKNNKSYKRFEPEKIKNDTSVNLNPTGIEEINFAWPNIGNVIGEFNDVFWSQCYAEYIKNYSVYGEYGEQTIYTYKVQRTDPMGGYHIWHCEDGDRPFASRTGVYILYLNDVEEGGETEFLYFSKRYKPVKNRLMIFPSNFPWAHRGNPPLSGSKYIMTGWVEYK